MATKRLRAARSIGLGVSASIVALACAPPPPGTRDDHEATIVELALRQRLRWLAMAYGSNGVVYCVDGAWNLSNLQAEGYPVRPFFDCLSDHVPHVRGAAEPEPFWRDHPLTAPLFVKRVSWPRPHTGMVELLDGGTPRETGITARLLTRFEFVWKARAWQLVAATTEPVGP